MQEGPRRCHRETPPGPFRACHRQRTPRLGGCVCSHARRISLTLRRTVACMLPACFVCFFQASGRFCPTLVPVPRRVDGMPYRRDGKQRRSLGFHGKQCTRKASGPAAFVGWRGEYPVKPAVQLPDVVPDGAMGRPELFPEPATRMGMITPDLWTTSTVLWMDLGHGPEDATLRSPDVPKRCRIPCRPMRTRRIDLRPCRRPPIGRRASRRPPRRVLRPRRRADPRRRPPAWPSRSAARRGTARRCARPRGARRPLRKGG
ncbi:hypothetical protein BCF33_0418 [Hasllibacter halocynthiae]|uniref:Uncharacterized protein n=1 Tax=Hasllibacter halocynthiae TaxID=595589 RepID=A0A2T0X7B4_9RHOB|nr:hypothetical protein BCF33_0418 [Hasllibacter halocynthiae]